MTDNQNFTCQACGEDYPIASMSDKLNTGLICKGCEPCPIYDYCLVDGQCEDAGDHLCNYIRDMENYFQVKANL